MEFTETITPGGLFPLGSSPAEADTLDPYTANFLSYYMDKVVSEASMAELTAINLLAETDTSSTERGNSRTTRLTSSRVCTHRTDFATVSAHWANGASIATGFGRTSTGRQHQSARRSCKAVVQWRSFGFSVVQVRGMRFSM